MSKTKHAQAAVNSDAVVRWMLIDALLARRIKVCRAGYAVEVSFPSLTEANQLFKLLASVKKRKLA